MIYKQISASISNHYHCTSFTCADCKKVVEDMRKSLDECRRSAKQRCNRRSCRMKLKINRDINRAKGETRRHVTIPFIMVIRKTCLVHLAVKFSEIPQPLASMFKRTQALSELDFSSLLQSSALWMHKPILSYQQNEHLYTFQLDTDNGVPSHCLLQATTKREMTTGLKLSPATKTAAKRRLTYLDYSPKPPTILREFHNLVRPQGNN